MRRIVNIAADDTIPTTESVLEAQGLPGGTTSDPRILELTAVAADIYQQMAAPAGLLAEINRDQFAKIYDAANLNEREAPLGKIYQEADRLALFTVTTGAELSCEISRLFEVNELPLASMLDSTASEGTELAADVIEDSYRRLLNDTGQFRKDFALLRFSPGYCGWHLSAQEGLFHYLKPGDIGITLSDSFLMTPIKSISGVLIAGPVEIFNFDDSFIFCNQCRTHACRDRLKTIQHHDRSHHQPGSSL